MGREPDIICTLYMTAADLEGLIAALTDLQFSEVNTRMTITSNSIDGPNSVAFMLVSEEEAERCSVCGWPIKSDPKEGCVPGNCSQRR